MALAMRDANINTDEVGYINAHGTGTMSNDIVETKAIKEVFGKHAGELAVSSTKSMHGHGLGAAGGIELVATILGLHHDFLPPTINYTSPDPECDLDYIPNTPRAAKINVAMSNALGFGGHNATIVVKKFS